MPPSVRKFDRRLKQRSMSDIEEVIVTTYTDDFFLIDLDVISTAPPTNTISNAPTTTPYFPRSRGTGINKNHHHDGPYDGPPDHRPPPPGYPSPEHHPPDYYPQDHPPPDYRPQGYPPPNHGYQSSWIWHRHSDRSSCTDILNYPTHTYDEPPQKEPDEDEVTSITTQTKTDYLTTTDMQPMTVTDYSRSVYGTGTVAADGQAQETSAPPPPPQWHPRPPHSPLKFILIGVFLGAFLVLAILACIYLARRMYKRRKASVVLEGGRRNSEGGTQMEMRADETSTSMAALISNSARESRIPIISTTSSSTALATPATTDTAEDPLIMNPFSDPTYNAGSGVDDYVPFHGTTPSANLVENPFSHPDDPTSECTAHPRPNSQGDFPPDYMTIDNDGTGQGSSRREDRFPFGDEALSDDGVRSIRSAINMGAGFGDGFGGYVFNRGLGTDLGQSTGEGYSGNITDSDSYTITESRPSMDVTSVRRSSECPIPDDLPEIDDSRGYVADGFGYRPGR